MAIIYAYFTYSASAHSTCFTYLFMYCIYCIYCIFYIFYIFSFFYSLYQVRALLVTLQVVNSTRSKGHIRLFFSLTIGHKKYPGVQRISCCPFSEKKLRMANRQDMVFVRPPGIESGGFEIRPDNVWYCKLLLLFSVQSQTDSGIRQFDCAFISVLEEYDGPRMPGVFIKTQPKSSFKQSSSVVH